MREPWLIRTRDEGTKYYSKQKIFKFSNGYGASVIDGFGAYGGDLGLFELAVVRFDENDDFCLCYSTPITSDVIGYLTQAEADDLLDRIEALPEAA